MSADLKERLERAAGTPRHGPDVQAALRRGSSLRRRRQALMGTGLLLAAVAVIGVGSLLAVLAPLGNSDRAATQPGPPEPAVPDLAVFERARTPQDDAPPIGMPGLDRVGAQAHPEHSRLAAERAGLAVYLIPVEGDPRRGDAGPALCVAVVERSEGDSRAAACGIDIPGPGEGAWALSARGRDLDPVSVVIVGDGLDIARTEAGEVAVEGNVALLTGPHAASPVTLEGPAGETTVTNR